MATVANVNDVSIRTLMAGSRASDIAKGKERVPRRKPVFPVSPERELARAFLAIPRAINKKSGPYINRLMAIYGVWAEENVRIDGRVSLQDGISSILAECGDDIASELDYGRLEDLAVRAARAARGVSVRDWALLVDDALDANINTPYYEETMDDMLNKWVGEAVSKITSLPQEYLSQVHDIIIWGYNTHQPMVNVYRKIEKMTGATKSQARMIARDQMGTLNCRMTQYEHESLGVRRYVWITKLDSRVRDCHRELHGKIFSWNNPPAMWYVTKSKGVVYTGRYCHPGEDYGCRCVAKPVFDDPEAANELLMRR